MSFELTPDEKRRVTLAALAGIKLDPIGHYDLALVIVLSIMYVINISAVAFLLWNRNYPPLKSKYPILMSCCIIFMFIWFLGDLVLKSHVHVKGPVLSNCMLFCVWMRVIFGCYLVSAFISIRSYALFCIFRRNHAFKGKYVYFSWGLVAFVALVFVLVTYVMPTSNTVHYVPVVQMCKMSYTYRALVQGLLWITWIVNAVINYRLRGITSSFNESREMGAACLAIVMLLTFHTTILYVHPLYPTRVAYRITETMLSHIITNSLWWYIMRTPMYNCFMRKTEYLIEWKEKLVRDGLQKQYQINRTDPFSTTMLSYQQNNNTETKFITMPGHALTYDASRRNSFSSRPMYPMEDCGARNWYYNNGCGISIESSNNSPKDDNSHIVLFSPHRPNPRQLNQLENMSSATTVHDDGIDLSRYHFPTPTTKQS